MMYQENDTLNKGQQNQSNADKSKNKDAMTAKLLASVAAGLAVGAGATYAANHVRGEEEPETEVPQTEDKIETEEQLAEPTVEERVAVLEEKERIREEQERLRQEHEAERQRQEQQRQQNEVKRQKVKKDDDIIDKPAKSDYFKDHKVEITSVEERTLEDGTKVTIYHGTVDGHDAAFMADSNGKVVAALVDTNDNGNVDDNEVIDLRPNNMTTQLLAQHQVTSEVDHNVEVIAVEHDVELGGETVDVALVSMDNQSVMLVDRDQNGEVDVAIIDSNNNGHIDEGEAQDVSSSHITMPTEDDITGNVTARIDDGDTEDYSNNADVTVYDV